MTTDGNPWFAVESKITDKNVSPNLLCFKEKLNIPFLYQVVQTSGIDRFTKGVRIISADRFLAGLI